MCKYRLWMFGLLVVSLSVLTYGVLSLVGLTHGTNPHTWSEGFGRMSMTLRVVNIKTDVFIMS